MAATGVGCRQVQIWRPSPGSPMPFEIATLDVPSVRRTEILAELALSRLVASLVLISLVGPRAWPSSTVIGILIVYVAYAAGAYLAVRHFEPAAPAARVALSVVDLLAPLAAFFAGSSGPRQPSGLMETVDGLLVAGSLLTFVGLVERRRSKRADEIRRLCGECANARGFKRSLAVILGDLSVFFQATGARLTLRRPLSDRAARWTFAAVSGRLSYTEAVADGDSGEWLAVKVEAAGWTGVVEILEPRSQPSTRAIEFMAACVREVTPLVCGAYQRVAIRARATREARASIARKLHDGPIQSLIGADMSVEALRRHARFDGKVLGLDACLGEAQRILRQEVAGLRELMVRMRPIDVPPGGLPAYLERAVRRFSRETGIRAGFVAEDPFAAALSRHQAISLARIVHEGLMNVRKHSAATRVAVSLYTRTGAIYLVMEDNGRGFDARQPWSAPELIDGEARQLGAELHIESSPGRGVRLEVVVPQRERVMWKAASA